MKIPSPSFILRQRRKTHIRQDETLIVSVRQGRRKEEAVEFHKNLIKLRILAQ
jgi:hypothetical protein